MKLTKKETETIKSVVEIDLKMIQFMKGLSKSKSVYEVNLEKLLEKLNGKS